MTDAAVVRIFRFHVARRGFDEILRTSLTPDLAALPGVTDVYSGRQGPDESGPRIIVSAWTSREAMVAGVGDQLGVFHPEYLELSTDRILECWPVRFQRRFRSDEPRILRVLRGTVRAGELDAYVDDVAAGAERDAIDARGPISIYLAEAGDDAFLTISAWTSWDDVERATGGDIHRPRATRQPERLVDWDVDHYEVVPR